MSAAAAMRSPTKAEGVPKAASALPVDVTALGKLAPEDEAVFPVAFGPAVTAGTVDDALEADRLMEMVEGAVPEVELVEDDPPEVMLNWFDWARIAALPLVDEVTRLIWKAVPTGQLPLG